MENTLTATYSPEDNKLRLYSLTRLDRETYDRIRAAGFRWAPKQDLFFAPSWSPGREDLLLELCGEIGDEDKSLGQRAIERAERFSDYSDARTRDAANAERAVHSIADNIPLGQPILVGHHSERRARKDAERIENGMRRAVKAWKTASYWKERAWGAMAAAQYKERPDVRARRIRTIEAEKRKAEREKEDLEKRFAFWSRDNLTQQEAENFANYGEHGSLILPDGSECWSVWGALTDGKATVAYVCERKRKSLPPVIQHYDRWIEHYENRLTYEREMLAADGGLESDGFNFEPGGRVNIRRWGWQIIMRVNRKGGVLTSLTVTELSWTIKPEEVTEYQPPAPGDSDKVKNAMKPAPICNYPGEGFLHQTKEEWQKTVPNWSDWPKFKTLKSTETAGRHRVRVNRKPGASYWHWVGVYLTDQKRVDPPAPTPPVKLAPFVPPAKAEATSAPPATAPAPAPEPAPEPAAVESAPEIPERDDKALLGEVIESMRQALAVGVRVVSAPNLFPTPEELAARMVRLAEIQPTHRVLEPSAGTGRLLDAVAEYRPTAVG